MKTLDEKIEDLKKAHKKEIERENLKVKLLGILPNIKSATGKSWNFFFHELYGCSINMTVGNSFRHDVVELSEVISIIKKFPPLPMKKFRDGFCSFRLDSYVDKNEEKATIEKVNPIQVQMENPTFSTPSAKLEYYTKINGHIVNLHFYVQYSLFGYINYRRQCNQCYVSIHEVELTNKTNGQSIKWGAGSNESVNAFTIYNLDLNSLETLISETSNEEVSSCASM